MSGHREVLGHTCYFHPHNLPFPIHHMLEGTLGTLRIIC